jgi:hypothetical protein
MTVQLLCRIVMTENKWPLRAVPAKSREQKSEHGYPTEVIEMFDAYTMPCDRDSGTVQIAYTPFTPDVMAANV